TPWTLHDDRSAPTGRAGQRLLARPTRRSALSSVSRHSDSASLPQVIPAPVPKCRRPPSTSVHQTVRIAPASSARPAYSAIQPTVPQYGPRGTGSSSLITPRAACLGAPETEAGG